MKKTLSLILALVCMLTLAGTALAEAPAGYPNTNLNLIVGFNPGGDSDANNRLMAIAVEKLLGNSIAVSNLGGSNGTVAMTQYQAGPADGYTLVGLNTNALLSNYANGTSPYKYDDFEVVGVFGRGPGDMLFASKASGITSIADLIVKANANPYSVKLGVAMGGTTQIYGMMIEDAGVDVNIVDGGDGANRIAYLVGGHVDVCFVPYLNAREFIETGDVIPLGTISSGCSALPGVPSLASVGLAANTLDQGYIWLAPKGTDPEIVAYIGSLIMEVVDTDMEYQVDQEKINVNDAFALVGQDALDWLAKTQEIAVSNAAMLNK